MNCLIKIFFISTLAQLLIVAGAAAETTDREYERMDINDFIHAYAKQESKDIVIDPRVKANVLLISKDTPDKITRDEFHLVLNTHGYGGYEEGNLIVIIQQVLNKQRNIPQYDGKSRGKLSAHETVSTVINVKHHNAEELEKLLLPLVEQWGYLHADKSTNRLILVTTLGNAERLHRLVKELDTKPVDR